MTPFKLKYRKIDEFPGYFVCSNGRILGKRGKFLKPSVSRDGYEIVILMRGPWGSSKRFGRAVHSLICSAFHGKKPSPKHQVRHWDGNRRNNIPENLLWGTGKDNYLDRVRHGRPMDGCGNPNHKLSLDDVKEIKDRLSKGDNAKRIASDFGVVFQSIYNIKNRCTWKAI